MTSQKRHRHPGFKIIFLVRRRCTRRRRSGRSAPDGPTARGLDRPTADPRIAGVGALSSQAGRNPIWSLHAVLAKAGVLIAASDLFGGDNTRGQSSGRPRRWFGGQTSERPRPGPIKVEYHGVSDLVAGVEPVGRLIGVSVDRGLDLYIGLMPWMALRRSSVRSWPRPVR